MGLKPVFIWGMAIAFFLVPAFTSAASLMLQPTQGTFVVGSTFEISIYLNTEGQSVNALDITLQFPAAKLQMVSPATGNSIVGVWTSQPRFDNQSGTIHLQGGIPGGINVSRGLVATLTFRSRGVGEAVVKFGADSKILANDGKGTDLLKQTQNGAYELSLPPPLGPRVISTTHPDQAKWYSNSNAILDWVPDDRVEGYSYVLNDLAVDSPDNISEGTKDSASYKSLADGRYFFHLKALRDGVWGGVTHFAIKVDSTPPADFLIEVIPGKRTSRAQPVIQFQTTDIYSGVQRYEIKLVPLQAPAETDQELLFIEATSPYIPPILGLGSYDVIVRVYDEAGNVREEKERLRIVPVVLRFISGEGVELRSRLILSWGTIWILIILMLIFLVRLASRTKLWHDKVHLEHLAKELPQELKDKIKSLRDYRHRQGKILIAILLFLSLGSVALAQEETVGPPIITTVSENISNQEIFYIGGRAAEPNSNIIVYLQNAQTLETQNFSVAADKRGEWFYRHSGFLTPGEYILWAQTKAGETLSPPSPQIKIAVNQTALELGSSRVSYELLYFVLMLLSLLIMFALLAYTISHWLKGKKKRLAMLREIKEAEEAIKRSFAVLRRDIEAQLSIVHKTKLTSVLSEEEKNREAELKKDLEWAEKHAGKEIFDVEQLERTA